jgi:hypothetical protein
LPASFRNELKGGQITGLLSKISRKKSNNFIF